MKEVNQILYELREEYMYYSDIIKINRLDLEHHKYCKRTDHRECGAKWGHSSIMREIICRIWWWFTGNKPVFINIATKPKLPSIIDQIEKNRKKEYWQENEIEDSEYMWLMQVISKCQELIPASIHKPKKKRKNNEV